MSSARSHPGDQQAIGYLLLDAAHAMRDEILRRLQRSGFDDMRQSHMALAQHLDEQHGSRLTDLAAAVGLAKPTVVRTIDELVELGYVTREPDPADGRAKRVVLTERGRAAVTAGAQASIEVEAEWAELLGARRFSELRGLLERLRGALDGAAPDAPV